MRHKIRFFSVCLAMLFALNISAANRIEFVEFKEASVKDAARILATMSQANIAVTKEASEEQVTLLLQKTNLRNAIDMLSRVAGLWYRYNKAGNSYIIMTEQQYQDDIVVYRDDIIRTFTLRHQNVNTTAVTIQSLFGDRVRLTLQTDNDDFEGLDLSIGDTNEATTVNESAGNSNREFEIQEVERKNLADEAQGSIESQKINAGSLRQLGDVPQLDAGAADRLLGAKTPIFIATNRIHNLLHVRTSDENALAEIEKLINESDKPTPQVLLEMKIVKIDVGDSFEQDFDLSFNDALNASGNFVGRERWVPNGYSPANIEFDVNDVGINQISKTFSQVLGEKGTGFGFNGADGGFYEFFSNYVNAKISLLEKNNQAEVISKPVLLASNNRPARLFIGSEQVVPVSLETDTEFSAANQNGDRTASTTTTLETERRKIGDTLILMPSVNDDRTVTIDIFQDTSSIQKGGMSFPFYNSATNSLETIPMDAVQESNVKTVVVAQDGNTIALGGMINSEQSDKETVVPLLGSIPLIGEMFRSKEVIDGDSQYVMLITPHVLLDPSESAEKSRQVSELEYDKRSENVAEQPRNYQVADYVRLTRFAAGMSRGKPVERPQGLTDVPVKLAPLASSLIVPNQVSVWPVGSWQQSGLYITLLKVRSRADYVQEVDIKGLSGDWLASSIDRSVLNPYGQKGDETQLYLLSNQPFDQVLGSISLGAR